LSLLNALGQPWLVQQSTAGTYMVIDTTIDQTVAHKIQVQTSGNDFMVLEGFSIDVAPGA